ncbi:class I SAM-dependent methyltransferase [Reichenbachiella sp.]|uniref:class I SAM-dependent methyltransferase n=1 Tax=Reichenbachiella sp. TaxID=2184521 RepID=UPI003296EF25
MKKRIDSLLRICNIPIREKWEEYVGEGKYSLYQYWKVLGLIDAGTLERINLFKDDLRPTIEMINYFKTLDFHFKPSCYINKEVADVGSGFGFITFFLLLSGAKKVYSIGDPVRIGFIKKLYEAAISENLIDEGLISFKPEFIKTSDTTLDSNIADGSLGLVLLNDTLEHITPRIFPSLVKSSYNNLCRGGKFISRQQNTDSKSMLARLRKVWEEVEKNCLIDQRVTLINESVGDISTENTLKLALSTRGLDSIDFYEAIKTYKQKGQFPSHDTNIPPIDILTDVPEEGDTGIERICTEFKKCGFSKVKVYPDLMSSRRSRYFQPLAKQLPGLFLGSGIFDDTTVFNMTK